MINRRDIILAISGLAWMLVSINAKALRYGYPEEPRQYRAERIATDMLAKKGWLQIGKKGLTTDSTYYALVFAKHNCPGQMAFAVLGGEESASTAVTSLGPDVGFLESGKISSQPDFSDFQWKATLASALALIGGPRDTVVPVIAIWPRPSSETGLCARPTEADWSDVANLP